MSGRTLVFTDVVDSTQLAERLGDVSTAQLWATHDRRARDLLIRHRGREIDRTDGFFLLFDSAVDAAHFALGYHAALHDLALRARVGMHVGAVTLRENTPADIALGAKPIEVEGVAKPLAARVMGLALGGQTLGTAAWRDALDGAPPDGSTLERHGHYRLKGIEEPVEVFELGVDGASPFTPPGDADKAYRVVRSGELWAPLREVRHNLPAERDAFVGRGAELRSLASLLDGAARLVTVLGPGGTGKTRLVRRYARTWLGDWADGVFFCDLSEARSPDGIYFAVAGAMEVPLGRDDPAVQLGHAIASRGRCLVILDNFEQVVEHAAATVGRWLERASQATFVVTSRERLRVAGEHVFAIEPLVEAADAIELFTVRARAQRPGFALDPADRQATAEVVRLLDGLPLAIELAAARVRVLSPAQLLERIRHRFALLGGVGAAAGARQATLRRAIDWSWDLLAPWEQGALAQCAVFEGGFTLEAAEAVLDLSPWSQAPPTIDVVQALVDKSLLHTRLPGEPQRHDIEEPYFAMYLSIHEYALERLQAAGADATHRAEERHGRYFAQHGSDQAIEALSQHDGVRRRRRLALEVDNLLAACRRALARGDRDSAVPAYRAAWEVLALRGPVASSLTLGAQVVSLPDLGGSLRVVALTTLASTLSRVGRFAEAQVHLDEALALARAAADPRSEGRLLLRLARLDNEQSLRARANERFEAALTLARGAGDAFTEGRVRAGLGLLNRVQGRPEAARTHFEAALAIARAQGDRLDEGAVLGSLSLLLIESGEMDAARTYLESALTAAREAGDLNAEGALQANLGMLCSESSRSDDARVHMQAAVAIHRRTGNRLLEAIALGNLGPLELEQGRTAEAQEHYEAALAISRELGNRRHQAFLLGGLGMVRHQQGRLREAREDYDAALAIAGDIGDRRTEGFAAERCGVLHAEQGQLEEARAWYERALACAREGGYRRLEGIVLRDIGEVQARSGRATEALDSLRAGEAILREVLDRSELGRLLCLRAEVEAGLGQRASAAAALAEATAIAQALASRPESTLGRAITRLRDALA